MAVTGFSLCSLSPYPSLLRWKGDGTAGKPLGLAGVAFWLLEAETLQPQCLCCLGTDGKGPSQGPTACGGLQGSSLTCYISMVFFSRGLSFVSMLRSSASVLRCLRSSEAGRRLHGWACFQSKSWCCQGQGKTSHSHRII